MLLTQKCYLLITNLRTYPPFYMFLKDIGQKLTRKRVRKSRHLKCLIFHPSCSVRPAQDHTSHWPTNCPPFKWIISHVSAQSCQFYPSIYRFYTLSIFNNLMQPKLNITNVFHQSLMLVVMIVAARSRSRGGMVIGNW